MIHLLALLGIIMPAATFTPGAPQQPFAEQFCTRLYAQAVASAKPKVSKEEWLKNCESSFTQDDNSGDSL